MECKKCGKTDIAFEPHFEVKFKDIKTEKEYNFVIIHYYCDKCDETFTRFAPKKRYYES